MYRLPLPLSHYRHYHHNTVIATTRNSLNVDEVQDNDGDDDIKAEGI